jgi:hypothetical protein
MGILSPDNYNIGKDIQSRYKDIVFLINEGKIISGK